MTFKSRKMIAAALLGTSALAFPAVAQAQSVPAPSFITPNAQNVDLTTGLVWYGMEEGGIGSGPGRVSMQRIWAESAGWIDNWSGGLYAVTSGGVTKMYVQFGGISDTFSGSGTTWTADKADGSTLTVDQQGLWNYTGRDGTKIQFNQMYNSEPGAGISFQVNNCPGADAATCQVPLTITRPDGLKFTLAWHTDHICISIPGEPCYERDIYGRLRSVTSSAGYSLTVSYKSDIIGAGPSPNPDWFVRSGVSFNNSASPPSPAPAISYDTSVASQIKVTDPAGRQWVFTTDANNRLTGIQRPGSSSNNISYTYGTGGTVTSATKDGVTNSYSLSGSTMTVTDPLNGQTVVVSDPSSGRPTSYKDPLNRTTGYQYDANARLTRITAPEGNYTQYAYDSRGNVTTVTNVPKSGSGLSNIVTSASFDSTCSNIVKCNKPNSTTDAKGNVTNYVYDPTHGGVTSVTLPAPTTGAVRPQTRYTYTQVTSASGDLVYEVTGVSACQTTSSCTGAADESKATIAYNSNLLPTSVTRANGTGTVSATTAMTYDPRGNRLTVDGPLSGTADTWAFKYDAADQTVGAISPDPDGAGSLKYRAIRLTYRPDGQVSKQEAGTTLGQSDTDWANFVPLQTVDITFDSNSRPVTSKLSSSGTAYALTQTSYDALGRVSCTAVRMNTAIYGSLPASACTLGTQGSYGPDRISQTVYDAASQVIQNKVAVGTSDAATASTLTYSNNGMLATLKDGENNLTTFVYDGFDRLSQTQYPNPTKGSGTSNASDYEQLTYDANGNVTQRRLRDAGVIGFTYDNLNRVTVKGPPNPEATMTYGYDNLNRLTSANKGGSTLSFTYDALGRNLTQVSPQGTVTSTWDAAGRRTQLTYPGTGLYLNYDYLLTGEVTKVRENGATSGIGVLATYGYDDLGNRTSAAYGNGTAQAFGYDPVSRLSSLTVDLSGTASDLTKTFAYNPASQIVTETRSNDACAQVLANSTQTTVTNGLNQLSTVNGTAAAYDARGNMTTDPATAKTYSYYGSNNQLYTVPSPYTVFSYDALDRLASFNTGAPVTNYVNDGTNPIAEYDGSNVLQKRYAFGPGGPLVQYDASGNRTWMVGDERGSVIALANDSGAMTSIDTYDEYGIPGAANTGTFQYAGMLWLSRPGLYAPTYRAYGAHLGRFGQTDPIGMAGGVNLYSYVFNDPVNLRDALGLIACPGEVLIYLGTTWEVDPSGAYVATGHYACASLSDFTPRGRASGGGTGGGSGGDDQQQQNEFTCTTALGEPGKIKATGLTYAGVLGIGLTVTRGSWVNLATGTTGNFTTVGFAAGFEAGAGFQKVTYSNLATLAGSSDSFSIGATVPLGPIAVGGGYNYSSNESGSGSGGFLGVGSKNLPFLGVSGNYSETQLSNCHPKG